MVTLQSAESIAEVAHANRQVFTKEVLEGPVFKSMVRGIEEAAIAGKNQYELQLDEKESSDTRDVLLETLLLAGYKITHCVGNIIIISWGKEDKK
jgi:hypothetical protein